MQIKQRVHLPMKLFDQEGIWKTQFFTDSLSPKIKPPYNNLQNITESSVARFPANKFAPITDAYQWNAHDHLE